MGQHNAESRWERRPGWARLLRAAVFIAPVLASFAAAVAVRAALPPPVGLPARAVTLVVLLSVSTLVLIGVDSLGRRALPLVTLLDLSMLFPNRAPSRIAMARDAIRRRPIEEQLQRVREAGADPGAAAREILGLVAAMSAHDRPTRGHAERVRMFTDLIAEQMRVPARDRDLLRWASILHDIGKLRLPATLLNKPGRPNAAEWALLRQHPAYGAEMAAALLPWLGEWGAVVLEHHERYDGTGYPAGLSGSKISLGARIVAVADAYDVMTSVRAYRRPVSRAAACRELVRYSGMQFDPAVVRAMVAAGAPRLRRAQGIVAWIADIPLVASGVVPAATVARVVGAGALATGAVTGSVVVGDSLPVAPRQHVAVTVDDSAPDRVSASGATRSASAGRAPAKGKQRKAEAAKARKNERQADKRVGRARAEESGTERRPASADPSRTTDKKIAIDRVKKPRSTPEASPDPTLSPSPVPLDQPTEPVSDPVDAVTVPPVESAAPATSPSPVG